MPTSGVVMPAFCAKRSTVATSQAWVGSGEPLISCSLVVHLAIGLLISSEMNAPPKPITSAKPSSELRFSPLALRKRFRPNRLTVRPSTSITPRLVNTNKAMRFIVALAKGEKSRRYVDCGGFQGSEK